MITSEYSIVRCYLPGGSVVQVYFNLGDSVYAEALKDLAHKNGSSISYMIRRLLRKALKVKSSKELASAIERCATEQEVGKSKLLRNLILGALQDERKLKQ